MITQVLRSKSVICLLLAVILLSSACQKEPLVQYGINEVEVNQAGADKPNQKTIQQYISIAYSDLFGKQITNNELVKLNTIITAFGDKQLIEEMIVKSFLVKPGVLIPTAAVMKQNPDKFISDTYKKLLNREPRELEKWYFNKKIKEDVNISPTIVYYCLLTSKEYRKF